MKNFYSTWPPFLLLVVFALFKTAAVGQLQAGFSATQRSGCPPLVVSFKDNSTGEPTTWKWDLGNGTISHLQNPVTTYLKSGSYTVKLVVENADGTDSVVKANYIVVSALPKPAFGSSAIGGCFPLDVQFSDSSIAGSGFITNWKWDFGDGTLSNEQNPLHTYTQAGSFTVVLRITNSKGCTDVVSKTRYINIENGVKADFSYESQLGCHAPASVNFTNKSVGTGILNYTWDFGDGKTSTEQNPVHQYQQAGVYTVKLIASNSFECSNTVIKQNAINIGFVKANFAKPDTVCAGASFQLKNTSYPSTFISSSWSFGDGTFSDVTNAVKSYNEPGKYTVKLITDFGSCRDSAIKPIIVLPQREVTFTAVNNIGCNAPMAVTFHNTTTGAVSYLWNFGDNTTSTAENPVHTYKKKGEYTVTLTVNSAIGCPGSLIQQSFVKITPPNITSIKNLPLKGCVPATARPVAVISNNVAGSKYVWDFGDGTSSTDSVPSHTYTIPGYYNIKLTLTTPTGCIDTFTAVRGAQVGTKPVSDFSANPLDVCANTPVNFTDLSTGSTANNWLWGFGDRTISVEQNPVHIYGSTGKFTVTLVVSNFGCSDTLKKRTYINVRPPIARFDTAFNCNEPLTRDFIDKSTGPKTWQWNFGDGVTSSAQNVSHSYAFPGTYSVNLTVTNGGCKHTITKDVVVINEKGNLVPAISEGCVNTSIVFNVNNLDTANISSYAWYFKGISGDSAIHANNPATYVYDTAGAWKAAVVVTDKLKCSDTLYSPVPVAIYGPQARFGSSNASTCFGNTVNFIDSSVTDGTHSITNYTWNFGEGTSQTYTSAPFSHNYSTPGTYNVMLVVKDTYGCTDTVAKPSFVSVTKPVAQFTPSDSVICPQEPITFNNFSKGVGLTYLWKFGDGTISSDSTPMHLYEALGVYVINLKVTDSNGCSDSTSATIKIGTAMADFSLSDSFSTCPPLVVNLTNHSTNYQTYNWDFGDGGNSGLVNPSHIYTYPGVYTIKLTLNSNNSCIDSMVRKVVIQGPTGVLNYTSREACNPKKIDFSLQTQNAVNFIWDFDDGTAIVSGKTTSHTYTSPGTYLPRIILEDANGCKVPMPAVDTIKIVGIETNISVNNRLICDSGYIMFRDSTISNDIVNSWKWDFGDGTTSTAQSPEHKYTDTGMYSVSLISRTQLGCSDTAVNQKYIKIAASPMVKISGDTAACESAEVKLQGELVRTNTFPIRWSWNFGNGNLSDVEDPSTQQYAAGGTYPVTLKATDGNGCYDSVVQQVIIHPKPVVSAGADTTICKFTGLKLHATGADNYTWTYQPSLSCTNCATPTAKPDETITYHLLGKTVFNCTNEDSITVNVQQPFKIEVNENDTVCLGKSIVLKAAGADIYQWSPSTWLDNANSATPKSTPTSSITYKVIGKDRFGCFADERDVKLKVYSKPTIEITNGDNIVVSAGGSIKLLTKNSPDVINWKWSPSRGLNCIDCAEPIAAPGDNITYHVTASNEGHCEAGDDISISVICNNANVYMPNTFSPNNDGSNDIFYPRGTGLYTIKSFKIFNRWGQMVFSENGINANDPQYGWDGTFNGVLLQPDVYVYILEVVCTNNVILPIKGNVTLIK